MSAKKKQKVKKVQKIVPMGSKSQRCVLVGTYKKEPNQLAWIGKRHLYNYPLSGEEAEIGPDEWSKVKELWLYSGAKDRRHIYTAEFDGIKSCKEFFAEYPDYPKSKKPHGDFYAVFRVKFKYQPTIEDSVVLVRASDFRRTPKVAKAVKAYQAGGELGSLLDILPSELASLSHGQLHVCDPAVQLDFFDDLVPKIAKIVGAKSSKQKFALATVFSGIGAIEQAFLREHIEHEIVFACDNGDQTPFPCKAVEWKECVDEFDRLRQFVDTIKPTTDAQQSAADIVRSQCETIKQLLDGAPAMSKRPERELKDRVHMLYEAVGFYKFRVTWEKEPDCDARKRLVDMLYRPLLNRNNVRKSYVANYDVDDNRFHWNVSFLEGAPYRNKVDLLVGGSPCQSFSLVGKQMGLSDTRGTLFYDYARLISEIRPKCFIYENVRALLSNDSGRTWQTMSRVFTELGYDWKYAVLNSKDYGIPQNRERVFVVGFRKDLRVGNAFKFPKPKKLTRTMQDFLLDVVPGKYYLPEKGVKFVLDEGNLTKRYTQVDGVVQLCQKKNQQFNWHGDFVFVDEGTASRLGMPEMEKYYLSEKVRKYVLASGTKTFYSRPQTDLPVARPLLTSMHKMHRAGVDNYITRDGRIRKLAPRECLRLMGFSDSFKIVVPDTSMYQQAGNAIVVDVLVSILNSIKATIPNFFTKETA